MSPCRVTRTEPPSRWAPPSSTRRSWSTTWRTALPLQPTRQRASCCELRSRGARAHHGAATLLTYFTMAPQPPRGCGACRARGLGLERTSFPILSLVLTPTPTLTLALALALALTLTSHREAAARAELEAVSMHGSEERHSRSSKVQWLKVQWLKVQWPRVNIPPGWAPWGWGAPRPPSRRFRRAPHRLRPNGLTRDIYKQAACAMQFMCICNAIHVHLQCTCPPPGRMG